MNRLRFHLAHAFRGLRRSPGYAAAFILTLGLAIGVNSAVFSVVNGVLLNPLPFQDAERILFLKQPVTTISAENVLFSFMEIDDYRAASSTIDEFVEFGDWEFTVLGEREPHRAVGGLVTSNYFGVLGMQPALGRLLNEEDDVRGAEPVMLITDEYWARMFGRDPGVVGRVLDLENINIGGTGPFTPTRIVGVLQPGLNYTGSRQPDFYVNYAVNNHYQDAAMRDARGHRMTSVFARMAPGATLTEAQTELSSIAAQLHREYPDAYDPELGYAIEAVPWQEELTRQGRPTFLFLMATVALVLLLAAANITNLTLTRLIRKESELATRAALGASRRDLRLQLTVENAVLGLGGGALGILLAIWSRDSLVAYASRFTVRAQEVGVDWRVLAVTLGGAMLVAVVLAWLPGLPVAPEMDRVASAQSKATAGRFRKQVQRGLVVGQLALSFTLLVGAGLLVRSLLKLNEVDPGFRTEQVMTLRTPVGPAGTGFGQEEQWLDLALDEVRAYPGVRSAATATWAPLDAPAPTAVMVAIDGVQDGGDRSHLISSNNVSPGYFETLGIPLVAGRYFDDRDHEDAPDVIILNQSMARAHFADTDPIGHTIAFSQDGRQFQRWYEIVGVVADSRDQEIDAEGGHTYYRPASKTTWGPTMLIASQADVASLTRHVRDVVGRLRPDRAVEEVRTMTSIVQEAVAPSRLNAILFGSFAVLALLIAALGVFSTLAFTVSQRVREFGIRMALGADREMVLRNVLGEGAVLVALALAAGAAGALVLSRFVSGLIFGVAPTDPVSIGIAAVTLAGVGLLAALLPALRATRIDPQEALRAE